MINILLLILAVSSTDSSFPSLELHQEKNSTINENTVTNKFLTILNTDQQHPSAFNDLNTMFHQEAPTLNASVINKVLTTISCANQYKVEHNNILTIIDYSLPSSEKRLWVFDLKEKKLLFHTYVSHGIKSGTLLTTYFSNKFDSKASSIGVYKTEKAYYGREGLSLRLDGLDRSFNDNASNRSVVMHGGWYVDEQFIKKYGRPGRSWGCPAVPISLSVPIINMIKENSLFVVYYPSDDWFLKSKFLHCDKSTGTLNTANLQEKKNDTLVENEVREDILFADLKNNNQREESDPIVVMAADNYAQTFHTPPPLGRMLRRQIDHMEYIALSSTEFNSLATSMFGGSNVEGREALNKVYFVIPQIIMVRGYYETQMKIVSMGRIKSVKFNTDIPRKMEKIKSYVVYFDSRPAVYLKTTNRFIRWLGL